MNKKFITIPKIENWEHLEIIVGENNTLEFTINHVSFIVFGHFDKIHISEKGDKLHYPIDLFLKTYKDVFGREFVAGVNHVIIWDVLFLAVAFSLTENDIKTYKYFMALLRDNGFKFSDTTNDLLIAEFENSKIIVTEIEKTVNYRQQLILQNESLLNQIKLLIEPSIDEYYGEEKSIEYMSICNRILHENFDKLKNI